MSSGTATEEFKEIAHSGGKIDVRVWTDTDGRRRHQLTYSNASPVRVVVIAIWALPPGLPISDSKLTGPERRPPMPGCFEVYLASDSEGHFGHDCPRCHAYWRSGPWPNVCPKCAVNLPGHEFLSDAQRRYVREFCVRLLAALASGVDTNLAIDMDAVADAVGKSGPKPAFYVSEVSQQAKFTCEACDTFNDIIGRVGFCSSCGTRNDLARLRSITVPEIRTQINAGGCTGKAVRDAVSAFDSFVAKYAEALVALVPLTKKRRERLTKQAFHKIDEIADTFATSFDIDIRSGIEASEWKFLDRTFLRRHVYEHASHEVDQEYLDRSGDTTVKLGQEIRETLEDTHRLLSGVVRMATNLHQGFHELLPPIPEPIQQFERKKAQEKGLH